MKAYKGFNKDMTCRGYQYEEGKTYELPEGEEAKLCENGFHAIGEDVSPLKVFGYYHPSDSRYCEVDVDGNVESDGEKIVGSQIRIGAEIGIPGLVKAHIEWVKNHLIEDDEHKASNTGDYSSASNTGYQSSAEVSGKDSVAIVTGKGSKSRGALGCWLVLTERNYDCEIVAIKCVRVDGETVKADTWYCLKDRELTECE